VTSKHLRASELGDKENHGKIDPPALKLRRGRHRE